MRVAIVNDLRMALETLRRVIEPAPDLEIAWTAMDGSEAVAKAAADRPDLVLMDLVMPEMDGVEATRRIMSESPCPILVVTDIDMPRMNGIELVRTLRADDRFKTIPVAVVSYKDREEDRQAGMDVGADAYLTKGSFREGTFTETVRDLLGIDP